MKSSPRKRETISFLLSQAAASIFNITDRRLDTPEARERRAARRLARSNKRATLMAGSRIRLYDQVSVCPGGRHAWFNSSVGVVRKPIAMLSERAKGGAK